MPARPSRTALITCLTVTRSPFGRERVSPWSGVRSSGMTSTVVWFSSTTMTRKGSISQATVAKTPERHAPRDASRTRRFGAERDEARQSDERQASRVRTRGGHGRGAVTVSCSVCKSTRGRHCGRRITTTRRPGPQRAATVEERAGPSGPPTVRFEIRIEKRRGKRSANTRRWNKLGDEGWELVAVVGKEAFFRRIRYQA